MNLSKFQYVIIISLLIVIALIPISYTEIEETTTQEPYTYIDKHIGPESYETQICRFRYPNGTSQDIEIYEGIPIQEELKQYQELCYTKQKIRNVEISQEVVRYKDVTTQKSITKRKPLVYVLFKKIQIF
ncbi:hypothetical protein GOV08_02630 [Candidatus Woesearchaeota archaeon]|nr:hypothetical protein [Candidatus Woesearchaeota archaeon]